MTIKSILVPVSRPDMAEPGLETAIAVASISDAHIDVLHVRPDARMAMAISMETMSATAAEEMMVRAAANASENASQTRAACERIFEARHVPFLDKNAAGNRVTASWREEVGYEDKWLQRYGCLTDLIVVADLTRGKVGSSLTTETALIHSGRPVLIAPAKPPPSLGRNIAIAWNGSAQAARAVGEARCLLTRAENVTILSADEPGKEPYDPEGLRTFLGWHNVFANIVRITDSDDLGMALLGAARDSGADLLVMGAYSHSRVREIVLGGVTRHVLMSADLAVLMMH